MPSIDIQLKAESIKIEETVAVIIAVENYRFTDVATVKYALRDADAFNKILVNNLGVKPDNIYLRTDSMASNTALSDEIKYIIKGLRSTDRFIFYYAGHGFYEPIEGNRLTAWDSSIQNLTDTTLSLRELVLTPLKESECKQSLLFLDACAKELKDKLVSRDAISDLQSRDIKQHLKDIPFTATYFACSPKEKSYSDDTLQHGIWSYYLFQALTGQNVNALAGNSITDVSLRDYLKSSVQDFVATKTTILDSQTPYANINSSNSFVIFELPKPVNNKPNEQDKYLKVKILSKEIILTNESLVEVRKAPGFKTTHYLPDNKTPRAKSFVINVFEESIIDEIQSVYLKSKEVLGIKRVDINKDTTLINNGICTIDTPLFFYKITVKQDEDYITYASVKRELNVKINKENLPSNFDYIFPKPMQSAYLLVNLNTSDFDDLVNEFEELVERNEGKLVEDDTKMTIKYTSNEKVAFEFFLKEETLKVTVEGHNKTQKILSIIEDFVLNIGDE